MERLALIFVPGITDVSLDQSAAGLASRLATALDTSVPSSSGGDRSARFRASTRGTVDYDSGRRAEMASVERFDGEKVVSRLDIYCLESTRDRVSNALSKPIWIRLSAVLLSVLLSIPRLRYLLRKQTGSRRRTIAAGWAVFSLGLLSLYFVFLSLMLIASMLHALSTNTDPTIYSLLPEMMRSWIVPLSAAILLTLNTVVFPFLPVSFRRSIAESATGVTVLMDYLNGAISTNEFTRKISTLIEHCENENIGYQNYAVIGYSFGSVIVLDTVFSTAPSGLDASLEKINRIVTIGCPFDPIAPLWPSHFADRHDPYGLASKWANVAVDGDPVSSWFGGREANGTGVQLCGGSTVTPALEISSKDWGEAASVGALGHVLFHGMKLHSRYWGAASNQPGCWIRVIPWALGGSAMVEGSAS